MKNSPQKSAELAPNQLRAKFFFVAAATVGAITAVVVATNVVFLFAPGDVAGAEAAGNHAVLLHDVIVFAGVGGVASYALYLLGMAAKYPSTHSPQGRLQKVFHATKHLEIKDASQVGFYAKASDMELHNFYRKLSKSPPTAKYYALILEIRKRVG